MLNLTPALWLSSSLALGAGLALAWRRAVLRLRASEQATRASRAELARVRATLHQRETDGAQLKRLLLAQQQINQICLEESDPQELLERSARALTEQAGYIGASVVLLSADGDHATHVGHAQCTSPSRALSANLQAGALPGCFRAALQSDATFIRNEPRAHCEHCPMAGEHADKRVLCHRLSAGGKTLGVVLALLPRAQPTHPEEPVLFGTIADDIAFGLSSLETKRALQRAATIIQRSPVVAFTWAATPGWPVTYATANVWDLFGYREADFLEGRVTYGELVHPNDVARATAEMEHASSDPSVFSFCHEPYRIVRPDGTVRWVLDMTSIQRDASGAPSAFEGIILDVTARQEAELALVAAKHQAETSSRAKSAFLAAMSHELRTPLNAILGFTHLLRREASLPPGQTEHLDLINRSGEHLLHIINDVLDMSKIEAGGLTLELSRVDVVERIRDVVTLMRPKAAERGLLLDVSCDCPRPVLTDATKLRQIVFNLLGNAIKFTPQGRVVLRVRLLPPSGEARSTLEIEVEDTGIGIASEDVPRLCEPFFQASHHAPHQGTGLGLSITRQYIEKLGGTLNIASVPGRGSRFRVALPVEAVSVESPACPEEHGLEHAPHPGLRMLIVEDESANAHYLRITLEQEGCAVRVAGNGALAIEAFKEWRPAIIWMDIMMPVMDGATATRAIRALPGGRDVKIIALSACAFEQERIAILEAGCDDFLGKPLHPQTLFACMARHLGETPAPANVARKPDLLALLPESTRTQLCDALLTLDGARISATIERLRATHSEAAEDLARQAALFRYTSLLHRLRPRPVRSGRVEPPST
ncbi:MAG TPA: ATP-binding protein [Opitutaceae bacterium]|nr:ATP-binding protein [Opitutaceae bacterium]